MTRGPVFDSRMQDRGIALLRNLILGQNGRLLLLGLQRWSNLDRLMILMKFNFNLPN